MKNIYLIGMMGSGKTTSGRELAKMLSLSFVDLDEQIIQKEGRSIADIFKKEGESYFRRSEADALREVSHLSNQIIATGGGIVLSGENRSIMKKSGEIVYLKTGLDTLWERVKGKKDRPLLQGPDPKKALSDLFKFRSPLYDETADKVYVTDEKNPAQAADEMFKAFFKK